LHGTIHIITKGHFPSRESGGGTDGYRICALLTKKALSYF
jgi:hypothetical protein